MANRVMKPFLSPELSDMEKEKFVSFEEINKNSLKNMLNYIIKLRQNNVISNKDFSVLQQEACSIYIENQVKKWWNNNFDVKISNKLNKIFTQLLTE